MQKEILVRYKGNPILLPNESNWWESKAVFNCATLYDNTRIHMLYRAIGEYERYISRIGYASSTDGYCFDKRDEVALEPKEEYERYGLEDPRLVEVDHQTYVSYVVLSNYVNRKPVASTALATTTDFNDYIRLGIITSKGSDNKDVVLFSENINQRSSNENETEASTKYLFLHRPSSWVGSVYGVDRPSIWIGEGSSLTDLEKHTLLIKPDQPWEMLKVGAGPPPIKTKHGWLLIYHGVNEDHVYRAGAALLDLNEPSKVLGRTNRPILEPKEPYEKFGDVNNVVFPTGACIMDGKLLVYYGAADKVCCLATAELENLIDYILKDHR
jgi:beta-1,2-mannobiose phosphorylase / 1,2-beta-oligomannan phosphorylase